MIARTSFCAMLILVVITSVSSATPNLPLNIISFETYIGQRISLITDEVIEPRSLKLPTSIRFLNGYEVITDLGANTFYYRPAESEDNWRQCHPLITSQLNRPHTLTYAHGYYYATDTDDMTCTLTPTNHHRILMFDDLESPTFLGSQMFIYEGWVCKNPHDVLYNPVDDYIYMMNAPRNPKTCSSGLRDLCPRVLWRFRGRFEQLEAMDLSEYCEYPRSLTIVDGKVYVNATYYSYDETRSRRIIEIEKFGDLDGPGKVILHSTIVDGYAINPHASAYYKGYWYSVNQVSSPFNNKKTGKITAWQDWNDFSNGGVVYDLTKDLGDETGDSSLFNNYPYNITTYNGCLYIPAYDGNDNAQATGGYDRIFRLKALNPIEELIATVKSMNLQKGIENSLIAKLESANEAIERGQQNVAVNNLRAFISEVEAQKSKKLTDQQADELVELAEYIISSILEPSSESVSPASARATPLEFQLAQNYPNPFNPDTWIPYQLMEEANVVIKIHNATGQLIRTLDIGYKPAGFYTSKDKTAYWDGKNEAGEQVASGIYFYTIQAGDFTAIKKMLIVR